MSTNSPPPPSSEITFDAKGILEFVAKQAKDDRDYFDKLLKWFGIGIGVIVAAFAVFGISTYQQIKQIRKDVQDEAKLQLRSAINAELQKDKIDEAIQRMLKEKTQAEFKTAIDQAVLEELSKPIYRTLIGNAARQEIARQLSSRRLSKEQQQKIALQLKTPPLGHVEVWSGIQQEAINYATDFWEALFASAWRKQLSESVRRDMGMSYEGIFDRGCRSEPSKCVSTCIVISLESSSYSSRAHWLMWSMCRYPQA